MKLCKNCMYCIGIDNPNYAKCLHPVFSRTSPVSGEVMFTKPYCDSEARSSLGIGGKCGQDGRLFKPTEKYAEFLRDQKFDARSDVEIYDKCADELESA